MLNLNKFFYYYLLMPAFLINWGMCARANAGPRTAFEPIIPQPENNNKFVYKPVKLILNGEVKDTLSERDIPTGEGGFARDYTVQLVAGDQLAIDLTSDAFDPVVMLMNAESKTIGKNDDGPDGSSNSLLFTRIKDSGKYIIRVQGFGETSSGEFKLKVSRLKS